MKIKKTIISYPITISDASAYVKPHLNINASDNTNDNYLEGLIKIATILAENYIGMDIAKKYNVYKEYDFYGNHITINEANLIEDISINIITDSSSLYGGNIEIENNLNSFTLELDNSLTSDPLTVQFFTGFETNNLPEVIKHSILIKVADLYDSERSSYQFNTVSNNKIFEKFLDYYRTFYFL